jgi:hypothetical protein
LPSRMISRWPGARRFQAASMIDFMILFFVSLTTRISRSAPQF